MTNIYGIETVAALSTTERAEVFTLTSENTGLVEAAVEKDFWVCWTLHRLFKDDALAPQLLFKGGTTLSKCYGLIERFSEDIDLILDWTVLTGENPYQERSKRKQDMFNKAIEAAARVYINDVILPSLKDLAGDLCELLIDERKPRSVMMTYPKAFSSDYIKPEIELEFGPMSAMTPNDEFVIKPYCADVVKNLVTSTDVRVMAIQAKKTFWDKVTILHVEAHRPREKEMPIRYSRHYYDLHQMIQSHIVEKAMDDLSLLNEVVEFKEKFYPQGWANYQAAKEGRFKLIPDEYRVKILRKDYAQLKEMIFGEYPGFDVIVSTIRLFEERLNNAYRN